MEEWNTLWRTIHDEDLERAKVLCDQLEKKVGASNPDLVRARKLIWFLEEPIVADE